MTAAAGPRIADGPHDARDAALSLWLPCLLPLVTGMLRDCDHCATAYLLSLPLVPGLLVPGLLRLDDAAFFVVGGAATLLFYAGVVVLLRRLPRPWRLLAQAAVVLAVLVASIGYANALRA